LSSILAAHALWPADVTLSRNGIRLERLTLAHEAGLRAAAADGALWQIRVTSVPEPDQTRAYIETALAQRAQGTRLAFAVIDIASETVIGSTSYHDMIAAVKRVEIGYTWYAKRFQRTQVNTTCKLLLMAHAFGTLRCPVVGWRTDNFNLASQRAIERLGAARDGVIRHHALRRDGSVRDTVMYSMLAADWPTCKEKFEARLLQFQSAQLTKAAYSAPQVSPGVSEISEIPAAQISLRALTPETVRAVCRLNPGANGEHMVAPNSVSLAQAYVQPNAVPRAIFAGETVVGFLMLYDPTLDPAQAKKDDAQSNALNLWRIMMGLQFQGKGFGEAAIMEIARYATSRTGLTQITLSYVPREGNASPFYKRLGFTETGELDGTEVIMAQPLSAILSHPKYRDRSAGVA
jgi:N-acetyltransferase